MKYAVSVSKTEIRGSWLEIEADAPEEAEAIAAELAEKMGIKEFDTTIESSVYVDEVSPDAE